MRLVTNQKRNGIQWTLWTQLDDLDFADDVALLSHNHQQMQAKTSDLYHTSVQIGLKINKQKTKILRINAGTDEPVTIEGEELGEVESFTYLGSVMDKSGGTDADVKTRIGKARSAFKTTTNPPPPPSPQENPLSLRITNKLIHTVINNALE